jgi:hypothetical protein
MAAQQQRSGALPGDAGIASPPGDLPSSGAPPVVDG